MIEKDRIANLILRVLGGRATAGERDELNAWLKQSKRNRVLFSLFSDEERVREGLRVYAAFSPVEDWDRVASRLKRKRISFVRWVSSAAAVLLLAASISWLLLASGSESLKVEPGENRAVLVLEDGKEIALTGSEDFPSSGVAGENIINDGVKLVYRQPASPEPVKWHTLKVPRGGEYQLVLSDGTTVTINADSWLRYPSRFEGNERRVELLGEAYFDVTKDTAHVFVVSSRNQDVRVLGTSFNVKAYPNEPDQTTLVSGRVVVERGGEEVEIKPGEQASWKEGAFVVREVDIHLFTSWKEERFAFENELLESVLLKLQRWYDIDVCVISPGTRNIHFTGNLPKYEEVENVLDVLALTTHVSFRLEGRTLFVEEEKK